MVNAGEPIVQDNCYLMIDNTRAVVKQPFFIDSLVKK